MSRRPESSWERRWRKLEEAKKRERDPEMRAFLEQLQDNLAEERKEETGR